MNKDTLRQIVTVLAVALTITVNSLANTLPLNGQNTGEISDRFPILFVPAGYVFGIWGIIYLGLIAYAVFQALPGQRTNPRLRAIYYPFVITSAANIAWIFLWHYNVFLYTLVAMVALLLALIAVYLRLAAGRRAAGQGERWLVHLPFSLYLGWITVATIANVSQVLYYVGWDGWGLSGETWTVIMLAVALVLAALMTWSQRDVAYLLVLVWAFAGIAAKQATNPVVMPAAWAATAGVALLAVAVVVVTRRRPAPYRSA